MYRIDVSTRDRLLLKAARVSQPQFSSTSRPTGTGCDKPGHTRNHSPHYNRLPLTLNTTAKLFSSEQAFCGLARL